VVHHVANAGPPSTGTGEFNVPHDVGVNRDSQLIVSDRENNRLQFFTLDGEYIKMFAATGPNKVQIDPDGLLHIGGSAGIEVFTQDGTRLGSWGERGDGPVRCAQRQQRFSMPSSALEAWVWLAATARPHVSL
jgi:hypothetical protein